MRVSGFTIIRDGVRLGYPFVESIKSLLPLVDELIVNVGDCTDTTMDELRSIDTDKLVIFETPWDPAMQQAGEVMAHQTNLALDRCTGDWCFYIQGDEVLHEADYPMIKAAMKKNLKRTKVEGLKFRYLHFRGDYNIRDSLGYRKQVRIVRNGINVRSVGDACGFGIEGRRLSTASSDARMFHYGYVRPPQTMRAKTIQFQQFYIRDRNGDQINEVQDVHQIESADYTYDMRACVPYLGSHPSIMKEHISAKDWETPEYIYTPLWRSRAWWLGRLRKAVGRNWSLSRLRKAAG